MILFTILFICKGELIITICQLLGEGSWLNQSSNHDLFLYLIFPIILLGFLLNKYKNKIKVFYLKIKVFLVCLLIICSVILVIYDYYLSGLALCVVVGALNFDIKHKTPKGWPRYSDTGLP